MGASCACRRLRPSNRILIRDPASQARPRHAGQVLVPRPPSHPVGARHRGPPIRPTWGSARAPRW